MRLDSPRAIGLAGSGLVLTGWLLGSTLSPPVARTQTRVAPPPAADGVVAIVPLRDLASPVPRTPPPAPTRNPFTFAAATRPGAAVAGSAAAEGGVAAPAVDDVAAAVPSWHLFGMAIAADGTLTAVLGRSGTVVLARAGDVLSDGATVTAVRRDAVELTAADGTALDLRLP